MKLIRFFHQIFRPNCDCNICSVPRCELCNEYKRLLEQEQSNNYRLFELINNKPIEESNQSVTEPMIRPGIRTWSSIQRDLERNDRAKAEQMKIQQNENKVTEKAMNDLEKELGINNAS